MATGSYLSVITLNVNGLNAPTKRQTLAEWIQKQDPYICCLQETHLKPGDTYSLKVKGWKKIFHAKKTHINFSLYVSFVLRWVSCRQHIQGSCFCIHSSSLCLLVGAFNPFTFKVIIDKHDPIAIYFVVWGSNLYTFSVFPVQRRSFSICWRAGLVVLNSLSFCLSVKLLISPSYMNEILDGYSNLGCRFFSFITLSMSCHSLLA